MSSPPIPSCPKGPSRPSGSAAVRKALRPPAGTVANRSRSQARAEGAPCGSASPRATLRSNSASSARTRTSTRTNPCCRRRRRERSRCRVGSVGMFAGVLRFADTYPGKFPSQGRLHAATLTTARPAARAGRWFRQPPAVWLRASVLPEAVARAGRRRGQPTLTSFVISRPISASITEMS